MKQFSRQIQLDISPDEVYQYHFRPRSFYRLFQPWIDMKVTELSNQMINDGRMTIEMGKGLFKQTWVSDYQKNVHGRQVKYIQVKGPFNFWEHTHSVEGSESNSTLSDTIVYRKPWYVCGKTVERELDRLFAYRHQVTKNDMHIRKQYLEKGGKSLNILIAGASGLVGTDLIPFLTTQTHAVKALVRDPKKVDENSIYWNPEAEQVNLDDLEGFDVIINLAGDSISGGRWTAAKKKVILESRLKTTQTLARAIKKLKKPPELFLNASAIGFYGDRGDEWVDEKSSTGKGFLADVCRQWEAAAHEADRPETRVATLRTGVVFSPKGGALSKMLGPFSFGLGGVLGSGKQWMSWVAIDEVLSIIHHIISTKEIVGPVDTVSPNPLTNCELTKILGKVLHRPTVFPLPAFVAKLIFGSEMAEETLLSSTRVKPSVLQATGYKFLFPEFEPALRHMLGRQ